MERVKKYEETQEEDIQLISKYGNISKVEAKIIWNHYSGSLCMGWASVPRNPAAIKRVLKDYLIYRGEIYVRV